MTLSFGSIALGALVTIALPVSAATVLVTSNGVTLPADAIVEANHMKDGIVRRCGIVADRCAMELSSGAWNLRVVASGVYSPEVTIAEADGADTVPIGVWPTATLTGEVQSVPSTDLLADIGVRITAAEPGQSLPTHEVRCPIKETRFVCQVPAAKLNLRVRAIGRVSHYFWDIETLPGKETALGELQLKRGASLVGKVYLGRKVRGSLAHTVVTLRPSIEDLGAPIPSARARTIQRRLTTQADRRGFFHFDGVPPGEYKVTAALGSLQAADVPVVIVDGREAALREGLVLAPPRSLRVSITPPLGPSDAPWHVSLWRRIGDRLDGGRDYQSEGGVVSIPRIVPGDYEIRIAARDGERWVVREFTVGEDSFTIDIHIPLIRVSGTVRLGEQPLPARITLGGETGVLRMRVVADEKGRFSELLAETQDIGKRVLIESEFPHVKRELQNVPIRNTHEGIELDLVLPTNGMSGLLTNEQGKPLTGLVSAERSGGSFDRVQLRSDKDGRFQLIGISAGVYRVQAQAYDEHRLLESELTTVEVRENDVGDLTLVLRPGSKFRARVFSTAGPVAGAEVVAIPRDIAQLSSVWRSTDENGFVTSAIPPGCRLVDVVAQSPGFATQFFRTQELGSVVPIALHQRTGTLVIETDAIGPAAARTAVLRHRKAVVPLLTFLRDATFERISGDRYRILVPGLEEGEYALCEVAGPPESAVQRIVFTDCSTGFLAAGGRLPLTGRPLLTKKDAEP